MLTCTRKKAVQRGPKACAGTFSRRFRASFPFLARFDDQHPHHIKLRARTASFLERTDKVSKESSKGKRKSMSEPVPEPPTQGKQDNSRTSTKSSTVASPGESRHRSASVGSNSKGESEARKQQQKRRRRSRNDDTQDYPIDLVAIQLIRRQKDVVDHTYHDFSTVPRPHDYQEPTSRDQLTTFAEKLHHILSSGEYDSCIHWLPSGRAFIVHQPSLFEKTALELYFGHRRYSSFLRQLNIHGFKHITRGADRNAYYHEVSQTTQVSVSSGKETSLI